MDVDNAGLADQVEATTTDGTTNYSEEDRPLAEDRSGGKSWNRLLAALDDSGCEQAAPAGLAGPSRAVPPVDQRYRRGT